MLLGGEEVGGGDFGDGAGEFAGGRVGFGADGLDLVELVEGGVAGDAFREDANGGFVLMGVAGGGVSADDVVVEDGFELPAFGFGEAGEVGAAVETLLFACDGDEDDGGGELDAAGGEGAGAFERDGDSAGVVIGSGGGVVGVLVGGVAES